MTRNACSGRLEGDTIIGKLFGTRLPVSSWAFRMNLMSLCAQGLLPRCWRFLPQSAFILSFKYCRPVTDRSNSV